MKYNEIKPQILLSTLWIFVLFNIIFRDIHEFLADGYIEEMISLEISEASLLFYGFILEIPIMMVVLSRVLNDVWNKWMNLVAAIIILMGSLSGIVSADMDDVFFMSMNILALGIIVVNAMRLSKKGPKNPMSSRELSTIHFP